MERPLQPLKINTPIVSLDKKYKSPTRTKNPEIRIHRDFGNNL